MDEANDSMISDPLPIDVKDSSGPGSGHGEKPEKEHGLDISGKAPIPMNSPSKTKADDSMIGPTSSRYSAPTTNQSMISSPLIPHDESISLADPNHQSNISGGPEKRYLRARRMQKGPAEFACDKCSGRYRRKCDLKRHILYVHSDRFICKTCGKIFRSFQFMREHEMMHRRELRYNRKARAITDPEQGAKAVAKPEQGVKPTAEPEPKHLQKEHQFLNTFWREIPQSRSVLDIKSGEDDSTIFGQSETEHLKITEESTSVEEKLEPPFRNYVTHSGHEPFQLYPNLSRFLESLSAELKSAKVKSAELKPAELKSAELKSAEPNLAEVIFAKHDYSLVAPQNRLRENFKNEDFSGEQPPLIPVYHCTSCNKYQDNNQGRWAKHEHCHQEFRHSHCPECAVLEHGEAPKLPDSPESPHDRSFCVHLSPDEDKRLEQRFWGCGFCCNNDDLPLESWEDRIAHIASHFRDGKSKGDWKFTSVMLGLLKQPGVVEKWHNWVNYMYGTVHKDKPQLSWNESNPLCQKTMRELEIGIISEEAQKQTVKMAYMLGVTSAMDIARQVERKGNLNQVGYPALDRDRKDFVNLIFKTFRQLIPFEPPSEEFWHHEPHICGVHFNTSKIREENPALQSIYSPVNDSVIAKQTASSKSTFTSRSGSGSGSGSGSNSASSSAENATTYSSAGNGVRCPASNGDKNGQPDDKEDGKESDENNQRAKKRKTETENWLACPYYLRDPRKYMNKRSCPGPGWKTVHRLKGHLYEHHKRPLQCLRCGECFNSAEEQTEHLRLAEACIVGAVETADGFDDAQEARLKSRKSLTTLTEAEKWRRVWKILFPQDADADIPEPYYITQFFCRDCLTLGEFHSYLQCKLEEMVKRKIEAAVLEFEEDSYKAKREKIGTRVLNIVYSSVMTVFEEFGKSKRKGFPSSAGDNSNSEAVPPLTASIPTSPSGSSGEDLPLVNGKVASTAHDLTEKPQVHLQVQPHESGQTQTIDPNLVYSIENGQPGLNVSLNNTSLIEDGSEASGISESLFRDVDEELNKLYFPYMSF